MAHCPANITVPNDANACSAVVSYTATASDNCPGSTIACSPASGATFAVGTTTVNCTATDTSGHTASCTFTVTVNDTQPPAITCPGNITVSTSGTTCASNVTFSATVSDNCPGATRTCSPASGSSFPKGTTTVNCTATDASGNTATCSFSVTVKDNTPPTVACPGNISQNTDPGVCTASVSYSVTGSDNCGSVTISCTASGATSGSVSANGGTFNKGVTTLTCHATDGANLNSANCSFTVTVNDTQPPSIVCPANITQNTDPNQCSALVSYTTPTPSDNCSGATVSCMPQSGTAFAVGATLVTCTAFDGLSEGTCTFTVTVVDNQPPAANCPSDKTVSNDPNKCTAVVTYSASAGDNCGATMSCTPASGSTFQKGTTAVACIAMDAKGNTASCGFNVTVKDTDPPVITCPANMTAPDANPITFAATASDNCPGATYSCNPPSGSSFAPGVTPVTCTATDSSGNTASCTFTVTRTSACTFSFNGFLDPIGGADATGGMCANSIRTFKLGSTIPVKFRLLCGGTPVATGIHTLSAAKCSGTLDTTDPVMTVSATDAATTGNQFRLTDASTGDWHYNLDTKASGLSQGTWQLIATLSDGSTHFVYIGIKR